MLKELKKICKAELEKREPYVPGRIVPASLQGEFELSLSPIFRQATVTSASVKDGIYYIQVANSGIRADHSSLPVNIIRSVTLAVYRFYRKHGVMVYQHEIYVMTGAYCLIIHIALNNYGLKQISWLNKKQKELLHQ